MRVKFFLNTVESYLKTHFFFIDEIPFRLRVFKEKKMWDVIRAQYIVDCVELQDALPLEPK